MKIHEYKPELFSIGQSILNQMKVWKEGNPEFAPPTGICWNCKRNIYTPRFWISKNFRRIEVTKDNATFVTGITIEESKKLITGCPHCNKSYCD